MGPLPRRVPDLFFGPATLVPAFSIKAHLAFRKILSTTIALPTIFKFAVVTGTVISGPAAVIVTMRLLRRRSRFSRPLGFHLSSYLFLILPYLIPYLIPLTLLRRRSLLNLLACPLIGGIGSNGLLLLFLKKAGQVIERRVIFWLVSRPLSLCWDTFGGWFRSDVPFSHLPALQDEQIVFFNCALQRDEAVLTCIDRQDVARVVTVVEVHMIIVLDGRGRTAAGIHY
jgi:hypothetical protein